MMNTATHAGITHVRKGKKMTHAVVTLSTKTAYEDQEPRPLVEWASSLELAQKNNSAHLNRAATIARGEELRGWCFDGRFYAPGVFQYSVIVEVEHP